MWKSKRKYKLDNYDELTGYHVVALKNSPNFRIGTMGGNVDSALTLSHDGNCWIDDSSLAKRSTIRDDAYITISSRIVESTVSGGSIISSTKVSGSIVNDSNIFDTVVEISKIDKTFAKHSAIGDRSIINHCKFVNCSVYDADLFDVKAYDSTILNTSIPISCYIQDGVIKKQCDILWEIHETQNSKITIILYRTGEDYEYMVGFCYMYNPDPDAVAKDYIWVFRESCEDADFAMRQEVPSNYQPIYSSMIKKLFCNYIDYHENAKWDGEEPEEDRPIDEELDVDA